MSAAPDDGDLAQILWWLAGRLAEERSAWSHVPVQVANALVARPARESGCTLCGGELPPTASTGRPRTRCLKCSPRRQP